MKNYLLIGIVLAAACLGAYFLMPVLAEHRKARREAQELHEQLAEVDLEMQQMQEEIRALQTDPRAVERVASAASRNRSRRSNTTTTWGFITSMRDGTTRRRGRS